MDWGRYMRAVETQTRLDVERLRTMHLDGKIKVADVPDSAWEMIVEHERLLSGT